MISKNIARVRNSPDITILDSHFIHGLGLHLGTSHGVGHGVGYVLVMPHGFAHRVSHHSVQMSQKSQFVPKF